MKKTLLTLAILCMLSASAVAQRVMVDNFDQLKVHYITPELQLTSGDYLTVGAAGYTLGGEIGAPALPMLGSLIVVPFCESYEVEVTNAVYDTINVSATLFPLQPSRCKSGPERPFVFNEEVYGTDAFYGSPLATVTPLGIGRDRSYAVLTWSPVKVNPVSGQMVVCRSADVAVRYQGSDAGATLKHYERYNTPSFSLGETLNTLLHSTKDPRTTAPVRMVIVAPNGLQCTAINEFVNWKRMQGMLVDVIYTEQNPSPDAIAAQLKQLYDEATDAAPAPTYVLLMGDHNNLPAFASDLSSGNRMHHDWYQLDDHITDLYYGTWSVGDMLPDCYQGRFSARDTATLRAIINKTLYYERYQFLNDDYLTRAALVAGVDEIYYVNQNDNGFKYADPTMDYIAFYYVNAANGYDNVVYYKNNNNYAPTGVTVTGNNRNAASALRSFYNSGAGLINYSAHGNWNSWSMPSFSVNQVNQMTNNGMPSFMIGNCCLSNKFDENVCFGEALLRRTNNAGAVTYIGATNSTFWGEDFYWTVGVRDGIANDMTPNYSYSRMGAYDRMFHTHGEEVEKWMVTAGRMVAAGNMSVNRMSGTSVWATSVAEYYWEIYELMGDPSLLPWLGKASNLSISDVDLTSTTVDITAVPGAYVALVSNNSLVLLSAAYAGADGVAHLTRPEANLDTVSISVTAQGYKPYFSAVSNHQVGLSEVSATAVTVTPNPASSSTEVSATGLRNVTLLNVVGQKLQTVAAVDGHCRLSLATIPSGLYLLRIETADGTTTRKIIKR